MADKKISALTGASTPLAGTEVLPIVQSSATVKVSVANLTVGRAIGATSIQFGSGTVLSDYEEGTWTPSVTATTGTITTVSGQVGRYVRIGRFVQLESYFEITTNGTGAGSIKISNASFTNSTIAAVGNGREQLLTGNNLYGYIDASTTNIYIYKYDGTYPAGTGYGIAFTITYQV